MEQIAAVILAAGKGTRMGNENGSEIPKVMFRIHDVPMIHYSVQNIKKAGVKKVVVVVGYKKEMVTEYLAKAVEYAVQEQQLGTGHAVKEARETLEGKAEAVLVCYGDMPLFKTETIKRLIKAYESEKPTIAMLSAEFEEPEYWAYGRIVRGEEGQVTGIVEQKDCSEEQLKIKESNPGFYIFNADWLWENIDNIEANNKQQEFYLTDLIEIASKQNEKIIAIKVSEEKEALGINTPQQLEQAAEALKPGGLTNGNI